ncbi:peptidase S8/S53 domain-containing protein [Parachaetomium inaequale]|uniref:Peptidase S8/S53 domain-containing protein n=1 Tax=Parachaetomium inaequale TaxID=2588326 RepID=A0AAN6PNX7_9PEZI|nr:peptidase S8/S53 domain-containing protein [Parachaetomium inaequale]
MMDIKKSLERGRFISEHVQNSDRGARVRVAIIDDGVDVHLDDLKGEVKAGRPCEKATSLWAPFYQPTDGHDTAMARLIATACPHVELYAAKLKTLNKLVTRTDAFWTLAEEPGNSAWTSTAHEAALAVDWARKKGVDVICMSWSLVLAEHNAAQIQDPSQTIRVAALKDNIIMYCPAARPEHAVGSATKAGHNSNFVNPDRMYSPRLSYP